MRANLTSQLSTKLDVGVRAGYNQARLKLPQNDNNDLSPIANGMFGSAEDDPGSARQPVLSGVGAQRRSTRRRTSIA